MYCSERNWQGASSMNNMSVFEINKLDVDIITKVTKINFVYNQDAKKHFNALIFD
jgi:uridylate kinase